MATQTSNRNSERQIHEAFESNGLKIDGTLTGAAGGHRITKIKFEDGSWLQLFAENHHNRPAICITINEELSNSNRTMANAAFQPIMNNLWSLGTAIEDAEFAMRQNATKKKRLNLMPGSHGINISWNDQFSKNMLYKLFEAIMLALPEIGLGYITDTVLEDLRKNYNESMVVA